MGIDIWKWKELLAMAVVHTTQSQILKLPLLCLCAVSCLWYTRMDMQLISLRSVC